MSGSPSATRIEQFYRIDYSSGELINILPPPDEIYPSEYIGEKFRDWSVPFEKKLTDVVPLLNKRFESYAKDPEIPLVPFDKKAIKTDNMVIEKKETNNNSILLNNPSAQIEIAITLEKEDYNLVLLSMTINAPIKRSKLQEIRKDLIDLF